MAASLNRYLPWYQVLEFLGFSVDVATLPARTVCPTCRAQTLRIYEDSKFGGAWHYCEQCRTAGDMFSLAMRKWKLDSVLATAHRLRQSGAPLPDEAITPESVADYCQHFVAPQRKVADLLTRASANMLSPGIGPGMAKRFALDTGLDSAQWHARMGNFLGVATAEQIREAIGVRDFREMFRGRPWKHALIMPFQNMPGRYSGLFALGGSGGTAEPDDRLFCPLKTAAQRMKQNGHLYVEPGLAMYESLLQNTFVRYLGKSAFVGPVIDAVRLQSQHLVDSSVPLPLVGMFAGSCQLHERQPRRCLPYTVWETLPGRHFVFWAKHADATIFNAASRCNGSVTIIDKNRHGFTPSPLHRLVDIQRKAKPWFKVLAAELAAADLATRVQLIQELDLSESSQRLLYDHSPDAIKKLLDGNAEHPTGNVTTIGRQRVVATSAGWYREPGQLLVSSGKLVLDHALNSEDTGELYYRGKIVIGERQVPFLESAANIGRDPLGWMQRLVTQAGLPPLQFDRNWNRHIVQLAIRFTPPKMVKAASKFGWSTEQAAFILPKFQIHLGGRIARNTLSLVDDTAPGEQLPDPTTAAVRLQPLLENDIQNRLFWAAAACLGANIIAPALNHPVAGLGLTGMGAALMGRVTAKAFGCPVITLPPRPGNTVPQKLAQAASKHSWPVLIDIPKRRGRHGLSLWLGEQEASNVVIELDSELAASLRAKTAWRFLICAEPLDNAIHAQIHGPLVLTSWLQNLCARRLELVGSRHDSLARRVLLDMRQWIEHLDHDPRVMGDIGPLLDDDTRNQPQLADHFAASVHRLISQGKLTICRAGFEIDDVQHGCSIHDQGSPLGPGVFIPRCALNTALFRDGLPVFDTGPVTEALATAQVLESGDTTTYRGQPGWLVNQTWWDKQIRRLQRQESNNLRIVG